jgi:hypothetical protein
MARRRRALRPAQEAELTVSVENAPKSSVYRATLESAVRAAVELWHKHHGARRVYISKGDGQIVKTLPPGDVLAIGDPPPGKMCGLACQDPAFRSGVHRVRRVT